MMTFQIKIKTERLGFFEVISKFKTELSDKQTEIQTKKSKRRVLLRLFGMFTF